MQLDAARPLSSWHDSLVPRDDLTPRAPLPGNTDAPWEREPLPWLGVHGVASLAHLTDAIDGVRDRR